MPPASLLQWDGYPHVTENVGVMVPSFAPSAKISASAHGSVTVMCVCVMGAVTQILAEAA